MKFNELRPPVLELAPGQCFHRVQLTRARKTSVRINGLLLAPTGLQAGRFCLPSEATAYLADSEHTALYESVFRRDVHSRSLDDLARRSLVHSSPKAVCAWQICGLWPSPTPCCKHKGSPSHRPLLKSAEPSTWTVLCMPQRNIPTMRASPCLPRVWRR